ncbi:MAG: AAA family ATPase [Eubacteriales bacterium]
MSEIQRQSAEHLFQEEINALIKAEKHPIPSGWKMSPRSVYTYIVGGKVGKMEITPKYIGANRLVEIAISTLVTDRSLLLIGEPGTAKSWLSEHLTAAINGDSTKVIQGTAGTTEENIRYTWNYALLIAKGPSDDALIKSPIFHAMETGSIARMEEISRCASEVQDALISILSEKRIAIPELAKEIPAKKGFSIIATANTRDKGVNDMSSALKRRFNIVVLPSPATIDQEMEIVKTRMEQLSKSLDLNAQLPEDDVVEKVCTIFKEIRDGITLDKKQKIKQPSGVLSTAEAISILANSMALAGSFGKGEVTSYDLAAALQGAIVKDESSDGKIFLEYIENVMKKREGSWVELYKECKKLNREVK